MQIYGVARTFFFLFFLWNVWHERACLDALNPCVLCHIYVLQGTNYKSLLYTELYPMLYLLCPLIVFTFVNKGFCFG